MMLKETVKNLVDRASRLERDRAPMESESEAELIQVPDCHKKGKLSICQMFLMR